MFSKQYTNRKEKGYATKKQKSDVLVRKNELKLKFHGNSKCSNAGKNPRKNN